MRVLTYSFFYIFFAVVLWDTSNASMLYKHVPFNITISTGDTVVVNYDFSQNVGIRCTSSYDKLWVDFVYKGHEKSAILPVVLQDNHIPTSDQEDLADAIGQLNLYISKEKVNDKPYTVSCNYLAVK